jgi:hypothetical protein
VKNWQARTSSADLWDNPPFEGGHTDPDRWRDVSRVFAAAVGLDRPARDAYLNEACRDDVALRADVDSMLVAHDDAGAFGDRPLPGAPDLVKRLTPGSRLGTFRIETLLGAGGMGEVYRARDTRLGRAVAIKVLPDSFAHDAASGAERPQDLIPPDDRWRHLEVFSPLRRRHPSSPTGRVAQAGRTNGDSCASRVAERFKSLRPRKRLRRA